ncbi:MAG TPA: metalloregulator ArsR/SmtB family transcription factor [Candidatus Nanopelagicales bacterium]|nr:metalloregulator ArsR/SmtB family transcription factor [Candidatus Nanopelagicales bacterium]
MPRSARTTEAQRPRRALVRNMSGAAAASPPEVPEVILEARPALDFLVSLMLDTESELLPSDRAWYDASRASLSDALRRDLARVLGDDVKGICGAIVPLVIEDPAVRSSADVVALAGRIDPRDLLDAFGDGDEMKGAIALARRVLDGEREERDRAVGLWPEEYRVAVGRLLDDPDAELRALRRVLRAWHERFEPIEDRVARMEERDVAERRADLGRLPLADFVEQATGGVRWVADPGTRRLYLSPSYFTRPYNYVFGGRDWHMFAYPLAESALDGDSGAVPAASVRLFKALGDESRLRILHFLASGDLYLTEIAERMGLSKPTVSHHLALLRAAGLVTITQAGALTYYTLRRDRIAEAGVELTRLLAGPTR